MAESFQRTVCRLLLDNESLDVAALAHALYHAPFALLSHGTEEDPCFRYANLTAQRLWETGWHSFIGMPSRLSAEPVAQAERKNLLARAAKQGYIDDYNGIRISRGGRRFEIRGAILWNVIDQHSVCHGQAATFSEWVACE